MVGIHASCCIGDEQRVDTELAQHTNGEGDFLRRLALIDVKATLQRQDRDAGESSSDQSTVVRLDRGERKVWNRVILNASLDVDFVREGPESGAQDDSDARLQANFLSDDLRRFGHLLPVRIQLHRAELKRDVLIESLQDAANAFHFLR